MTVDLILYGLIDFDIHWMRPSPLNIYQEPMHPLFLTSVIYIFVAEDLFSIYHLYNGTVHLNIITYLLTEWSCDTLISRKCLTMQLAMCIFCIRIFAEEYVKKYFLSVCVSLWNFFKTYRKNCCNKQPILSFVYNYGKWPFEVYWRMS